MPSALLDWPAFLTKVSRDLMFEKLGYYATSRPPYPTKYLSPTGLALSCDAYGGIPYVMSGRASLIDLSTYSRIRDGDVIWMRIEALPRFNREVLPALRSRFVLVTGESDWSVPSNFYWAARTLVESGKLLHWFTVNYDGTAHADLITPVPLGIEYPKKNELTINWRVGSYRVEKKTPAQHEAEWDRLAQRVRPIEQRAPLAVADFHFNDTAQGRRFGESRQDIVERLRDNPNVVWPARRGMSPMTPRIRYAEHAFVIVAFGRGLDGHRAWEALQLGCIVIVKQSPLDVLYRGLPVVSIDEWEEITPENLQRWLGTYGSAFDRTRVHEILSLQYWVDQIRARARTAGR